MTAMNAITTAHITPINDAIGHETSAACVCGPRVEPIRRADGSMGWLIVHHSLDGRERKCWW